jgi:hypothetical protein
LPAYVIKKYEVRARNLIQPSSIWCRGPESSLQNVRDNVEGPLDHGHDAIAHGSDGASGVIPDFIGLVGGGCTSGGGHRCTQSENWYETIEFRHD